MQACNACKGVQGSSIAPPGIFLPQRAFFETMTDYCIGSATKLRCDIQHARWSSWPRRWWHMKAYRCASRFYPLECGISYDSLTISRNDPRLTYHSDWPRNTSILVVLSPLREVASCDIEEQHSEQHKSSDCYHDKIFQKYRCKVAKYTCGWYIQRCSLNTHRYKSTILLRGVFIHSICAVLRTLEQGQDGYHCCISR